MNPNTLIRKTIQLLEIMEIYPGERFTVKINGQEIETVIDRDGVQRLPANPLFRYMIEEGSFDPNLLMEACKKERLGKKDCLFFFLNIGLSMPAFSELSFFKDIKVENPLSDQVRIEEAA